MGFLKDCQFTAFKVPLSIPPANFVQGRNTHPEAWWDIRGSEYIAYYRFLEANVTLEPLIFKKCLVFLFFGIRILPHNEGCCCSLPPTPKLKIHALFRVYGVFIYTYVYECRMHIRVTAYIWRSKDNLEGQPLFSTLLFWGWVSICHGVHQANWSMNLQDSLASNSHLASPPGLSSLYLPSHLSSATL